METTLSLTRRKYARIQKKSANGSGLLRPQGRTCLTHSASLSRRGGKSLEALRPETDLSLTYRKFLPWRKMLKL